MENVKKYLKPSGYGKGFIGVGKYTPTTNKKERNLWGGLMERCFSETYHKTKPTYKGITVCDEWLNFQNFAAWCETQSFFNAKDDFGKAYQLDKDLLIRGNKVYSPETCCFIPSQINSLFSYVKSTKGAYPAGVSYMKNRGKFEAYFSKRGKRVNLGHFRTPEEAFIAYKTAKETHIKEMAKEWKDRIDERVYQALLNYEVHIDD